MSVYLPEIKQSVEVTHPKFGIGRVVARYGEDQKSKVIVKFKEEGEKKLLLAKAKLRVNQPEPTPAETTEA